MKKSTLKNKPRYETTSWVNYNLKEAYNQHNRRFYSLMKLKSRWIQILLQITIKPHTPYTTKHKNKNKRNRVYTEDPYHQSKN